MSKDYALTSLIRRVLSAKTKGAAMEIVGNVGDEYSPIIKEIVARLTWKRTLSQNALLHVWFEDIAKHFGDRSAQDVKGECHRDLGLTIRLRNPQFDWIWQRTGALLSREKQAKLLATENLALSSGMTSADLRKYMDEIERTYTPQGVKLTKPKEAA